MKRNWLAYCCVEHWLSLQWQAAARSLTALPLIAKTATSLCTGLCGARKSPRQK
nr:hypothetical protein [Suipraeoptans intestinalis]